MAKEFLHKEGLTKLVENIKAWAKGAFLGKDATITKSSGTNKGVSVSIQGSVSEPSVSVSVTTSGVSGNNSGVVSGSEVKAYVDENAATKDTFKAATSSSNAVNGLVPAPSSANVTKFLRGDGTWTAPPLATNNTDGLMGADDKTTLGQSVAMVTPLTGEDGSCILEIERNDGTFLEFPVPKVGSAKEADNALKLGGRNAADYSVVEDLHKLIFNTNVKELPTGADLNDYTVVKGKAGLWRATDNVKYNNAPIMNFGLAVIRLNSSYSAQILMPMDPLGKGIYYRNTYWASENPDMLSSWKLIPFSSYVDALRDDITNGNITASKATTADSANAIGGKGLGDLVQGGGTIKHIKVVTSLPASPSNDTLYLIKQ